MSASVAAASAAAAAAAAEPAASTSGTALLMSSVTSYFQQRPASALTFRDIILGTSPISLRLLDWFVTHYARTRNVLFWIDDHRSTIHETVTSATAARLRKFHLYFEYRAQLKSYTKLYFDPFRRHDRITFVLDGPHPPSARAAPVTVETTVGQLNFFRWVFQNRILDYIRAHLTEVEKDMATVKKTGAGASAALSVTAAAPQQPEVAAAAAAEVATGSGAANGVANAARRKGSGGTHKNPTACMPQCRSVLNTHCHIRFD